MDDSLKSISTPFFVLFKDHLGNIAFKASRVHETSFRVHGTAPAPAKLYFKFTAMLQHSRNFISSSRHGSSTRETSFQVHGDALVFIKRYFEFIKNRNALLYHYNLTNVIRNSLHNRIMLKHNNLFDFR